MPIASTKPDATGPVVPELPRTEPKDYKSVIYDDNHLPLQSLIAYVEGAPWTITYYAQVVSVHNDLRVDDPNQPAAYQQYEKFIGLEVRVDQPLTSTTDPATNLTTVEGSANAYPFMKLNQGDLFITWTGDRRLAKFRVKQVNRKTFTRDSVYNIQYELVKYIEDDDEDQATIEEKVIRTYYFSKDRLAQNLQPFIKSEEYENVTNISVVYKDLVRYYFSTMFNPRFSTLVLPGQEYGMYDANMVTYLMRLMNTDDAENVRNVRKIPSDNDPYLSQPDLWQMLFERDYNMRPICNQFFGMLSKFSMNWNTFMTGFRYSTLGYLVYPITPDTTMEIENSCGPKMISMQTLRDTKSYKDTVYTPFDNTFTDTDGQVYPIIYEVLADDHYILSGAFWEGTDQQSLLEILLKDYLQGNTLSLPKLYACCNVFKKWKRLEQFYFGPILFTLLLEANRAQYT